MPYLALDTSTEHLSLAISTANSIIGHDWLVGQKHAELTLPKLDAFLAEQGLSMSDIEGIAFGNGPGSFTGLRIACGITQGLAFARNIPVIGVSTLEALAQGTQADKVIACLDARMNQIYTASYQRSGHDWQMVSAATVCDPLHMPQPDGDNWIGVGSGFAAYGPQLLEHLGDKLAATEPARFPLASDILALALPRFAAGLTCPAGDAELLYLRDKVALKTHERASKP